MTSDVGLDVTPGEAVVAATNPAVFISHATGDHAVAEQICRLLEENGIGCWIAPRNVDAGSDYAAQILDGIESTRVMVLLLSEPANASVFVKMEVERAISKGKVVIPFRIQEVQPSRSLELFISNHQWIDAWAPPLDSRVLVLAAAIRGLLRLPPLHGGEDRAGAVARAPNSPTPEQPPPAQQPYGAPQPQPPPAQQPYGAPQPPRFAPQPPAYAQPAPQPPAAPTVCPRCQAPLSPGRTQCDRCGYESRAAWGTPAPAASPRASILPIALSERGLMLPIALAIFVVGLLAVLAAVFVTVGTQNNASPGPSLPPSAIAVESPTSTPTAAPTQTPTTPASAGVSLAVGTAEPSPLAAWKPFTSPDGKWSTSFPGSSSPTKTTATTDLGAEVAGGTIFTVTDSSGAQYIVAYFDLDPSLVSGLSPDDLLSTMETSMTSGLNGTVVRRAATTEAGHPARDVTMTSQGQVVGMRLWFVGSRFYVLITASNPGVPVYSEHFFGAFKLK
jgi:hypothetical protein